MKPALPPALTVRYNRTFGAWLVVTGSAALLAVVIYDLLFESGNSLPFVFPYFVASYALATGVIAVLRPTYFTYDTETERIETRALSGVRRAYPRPGYDWIAYSTDPLQIREVAPGGRSRPISISHLFADPEDWAEFLDHLLSLSTADADPPFDSDHESPL